MSLAAPMSRSIATPLFRTRTAANLLKYRRGRGGSRHAATPGVARWGRYVPLRRIARSDPQSIDRWPQDALDRFNRWRADVPQRENARCMRIRDRAFSRTRNRHRRPAFAGLQMR